MLSITATQHINVLIVVMTLLFYMQPKHTPVIIIGSLLLFTAIQWHHYTLLYYELSVILAILCCAKHNRRHQTSCMVWLIWLSLGMLTLGLLTHNNTFLTQMLQKTQTIFSINPENSNIINESIHKIALLMVLGLIPFNKHIMSLFTLSSNVFKMICFIIPMMLLQLFLQNNPTDATTILFGGIISVYSGLCLMFENNIRKTLVYIITYFYGLNIVTTSQHASYTHLLNNAWLMVCVSILAYTKIIAPRRTHKYLIQNIKTLTTITKKHTIISIWWYIIITSVLFIYYAINSFKPFSSYWLNLIVVLSFTCFTAKIFYTLSFGKNNNTNPDKTDIKNTEIIKTIILFLCVTVGILYTLPITTSFIHINFTKQTISGCVYVLVTFIASFLISKLLIITPQPKHALHIKHQHTVYMVLDGVKVVIDIIYISVKEFYAVIKNNIQQTLSSSTPTKLTNLLHNNQMYFCIFFLIEVIVVLTIECVIT